MIWLWNKPPRLEGLGMLGFLSRASFFLYIISYMYVLYSLLPLDIAVSFLYLVGFFGGRLYEC